MHKEEERLNKALEEAKDIAKEVKSTEFAVEEIEDEKPESTQGQVQPKNRKQKRLLEKQQRRAQKLLEKRIMDYIRKHPEAIKVDIDEDKIKEVEEKESHE